MPGSAGYRESEGRGAGVAPIGNCVLFYAMLGQLGDQIDEAFHGTAKPIQLPDNQAIHLAAVAQRF